MDIEFRFKWSWIEPMIPYGAINAQTVKPLITKKFNDAGYDVRVRNIYRKGVDYISIEYEPGITYELSREFRRLVLQSVDYWGAYNTYSFSLEVLSVMKAGCELMEVQGLDTTAARLMLERGEEFDKNVERALEG